MINLNSFLACTGGRKHNNTIQDVILIHVAIGKKIHDMSILFKRDKQLGVPLLYDSILGKRILIIVNNNYHAFRSKVRTLRGDNSY